MQFPAAFEPIGQAIAHIRDLIPSKGWFKRPHFNFITLHYFYLIGFSLVIGLCLYAGGLPFIDALFFSGGASTQSGLNTIDVNLLYTYQQVMLMLTACLTTPIFINTAVVFVRIYWFEKRFRHIVRKQRDVRKTWERSRSKSEAKADLDLSRLENGVNGREITVLHETTRPNGMSDDSMTKEEAEQFAQKMGIAGHEKPVDSSGSSSGGSEPQHNGGSDNAMLANEDKDSTEPQPLQHRTITFPDDLPQPEHSELSQHIAIVQRQQQNAKAEGGTLRIPGPRDFDRGELPEEIDEPLQSPLKRVGTADSQNFNRMSRLLSRGSEKGEDPTRPRHAITFNEPDRPPHSRQSEDAAETKANKNPLTRLVSPLLMRHKRSTSDLGERKNTFARTLTNFSNAWTNKEEENMPYFSWEATIGRNSAFVNLTAAQREELGGIEYRALKLLAKILICYYVGFHIFGMMVYLPWILHTQPWRSIVESDGQDPGWWGVFTAASMFNDLGLTLTPDSMISFQTATLILLVGSFLIIIGNTGFPVMLRFVIWVCSKFSISGSPLHDELRFLLDHPRRCFTLLFPSRANWWLFWILVLLNGIDLLFFIILDLNDPTVTDLPPGFRVLNGWFQATSTRTAGFSSVNIANLHPGIQVSYMIMMYISVLPIAISVRRTNVYEEKSLGIWGGEDGEAGMEDPSYVGQHLRRQLSFDLWYIFLGFFIISIVEGDRLQAMDDPAFSMFSVLFEIVSAYGTVGLSLGYPTINASFSAEFHTLSKLVIVAMMIRGRHRGLPYALDRAILLPSEKQYTKEAEDADRRFPRRGSAYAFNTSRTWEDGELDENGLPRQHGQQDTFDPMSAGAGGDRRSQMERRGSTVSSASAVTAGRPRVRGKSLATLLSMGLSAGPTFTKHD